MVRIPTLQSWRWHQVTRLLWIYLHHFQQLVKHTLQQLWRWGGKRWQKVSNVSSEGQHSGGSYQWQQRCVVSCTSLLGIAVRRMQCLSLNFQSDNTAELPPNKKICPVAVRVLFFFFCLEYEQWQRQKPVCAKYTFFSTMYYKPHECHHLGWNEILLIITDHETALWENKYLSVRCDLLAYFTSMLMREAWVKLLVFSCAELLTPAMLSCKFQNYWQQFTTTVDQKYFELQWEAWRAAESQQSSHQHMRNKSWFTKIKPCHQQQVFPMKDNWLSLVIFRDITRFYLPNAEVNKYCTDLT